MNLHNSWKIKFWIEFYYLGSNILELKENGQGFFVKTDEFYRLIFMEKMENFNHAITLTFINFDGIILKSMV